MKPIGWKKHLAAVSKEKKLVAHFAKLEQGKSTFALCIEAIDRHVLHSQKE